MTRCVLKVEETRRLIREALEKAGGRSKRPASFDPDAMKRARASIVRAIPSWVGRFGVLAGKNGYAVWCEPASSPGEFFPSQMVMDVPPGRYMIEIFDAAASTWVSRESAEGGLLVFGLTFTGHPVLVRIRFRF